MILVADYQALVEKFLENMLKNSSKWITNYKNNESSKM